jgi:hypothetical protein
LALSLDRKYGHWAEARAANRDMNGQPAEHGNAGSLLAFGLPCSNRDRFSS